MPRRGGCGRSAAPHEFAVRLRALGVVPQREHPWLVVGKPTRPAAWKLHVSATLAGIDQLFECVLPCVLRHGAHFKLAADRDAMLQLGAGAFGEAQIGKVLTVYPRNDAAALHLAQELVEHTRGLVGPRVATDLHLGEAVYARYGAVRPRIMRDRFGEATDLIPDGNGNWIPDLRPVPFACPQGITIPFPTAASPLRVRQPARGLLGGRYFVTDVVRPGLAGSVLRAIDLLDATRPSVYVLKQARRYCSEDAQGRDRCARLRHEAAVLARLRGLPFIAASGEYFEDAGIGYLPITYVRGRTLAEVVYRHVTGHAWRRLPAQIRHRLLGYAAQVVRRLRCAHTHGVIHRDLAPGNVWIAERERVYLIDWECAHIVGSRKPPFRLGTPGFSDLSHERRAPEFRDDWQACGRVLAFILTGLDPVAVIHGARSELALRLATLTELHDSRLVELLAGALAADASIDLDAGKLLGAIAAMMHGRQSRSPRPTAPLYSATVQESVLTEGLRLMTAGLRLRLQRLRVRRTPRDAAEIHAQSGIAGLLYVLAAAQSAGVAHLDTALGDEAARVLSQRTRVMPDLPGLVHGSAGCALAVAAAVQSGAIVADDALRRRLASALAGRLDWPDFTHGAAGQGFAALACARRLGMPELGVNAAACARYLIRTQHTNGAWTLPDGVPGASAERYTGFAHGAAGMMGFLGSYAALAGDPAADAAWRLAEGWLMSRAHRGRGGRWQWPQSDSRSAPSHWWCHGAPGIALGWLCVARVQGTASIAAEYLQGALDASAHKLRSDSLGQCHGLAGVGEVFLEACLVLRESKWHEHAAHVAKLLFALYRKRFPQPWHYMADEPAADADGLMLGTAGILHFLLRHQYPHAITSAPLLS